MCCFRRSEYFTHAACACFVRDELLRTGAAYHVNVLAYCVMPDHLHALVEGGRPDSELAGALAMFRQRTGRTYRQLHGRRLWQEGYYDRVLRSDDRSLEVARYIVANPMRKGLCNTVREYPYVGSGRWTLDELLGSMV
jgi:putative transposase